MLFDIAENIANRVMKITPIRVFLATIAILTIMKAFSVPGMLVDYWWYESVGQLDVYMTNFKMEWGIFLIAAIVTGVIFYINWRATKSCLIKKFKMNEDATRGVGSLYAFIGTLLVLRLASGLSEEYFLFLQYLNQVPFAISDPLFGKDIGFYKYTLPLIREVLWFVFWTAASLFVANLAVWLASEKMEEILEGKDLPFVFRIPIAVMIAYLGIAVYLKKYNLLNFNALA